MDLKRLLDEKAALYNTVEFIKDDPISIPHQFSRKQDIEIMAFFAATLAWGQRKTIIRSCDELIRLMDNSPFEFIMNHQEKDLSRFLSFRHRTFQPTDLLYFISFFQLYYKNNQSLENAFSRFVSTDDENIEQGLTGFYNLFFSLDYVAERTRKHIASPVKNSSCKRLNMFLRWMVRHDKCGVDFGIWKSIRPSQLLCPLDVHVDRVARNLGLITSKSNGWKAVLELTANLKKLDDRDPVRYDFALFGMGVFERY